MRRAILAGWLGLSCAGLQAAQDGQAARPDADAAAPAESPAPHPGSAWAAAPRAFVQSERYVETAPSAAAIDSERGTLPGGGLEIIRVDASGAWSLDWQRASSGLDYQGATQAGIPVTSRAQVTEERWSLARRQTLAGAAGWHLDGRAALALSRRDRDIAPTALAGGLREALDWPSLRLGLVARAAIGHGFQVEAGVLAERGLPGQHLHVDFEGYAQPVTLRPAPRYGAGASLAISRNLADGLQLWARAEGWRERIGATAPVADYRAGQPLGEVRYPGATLRQGSLLIGLAWTPAR